jgi:uroporphyrinogen-III synthase
VYQWDLPVDREPLREAVRKLARHEVDVVMFTTSIQAVHLFRIAAELGLEAEVRNGLQRALVASIGPTTTEALEEFGIHPALEPTHPKMGFLVKETAERAKHA